MMSAAEADAYPPPVFPPTGLYLVSSQEYAAGRTTLEVAQEAIQAGIEVLQMREKGLSLPERAALGKTLAAHCRRAGVRFIVNDDPDLAARLDADGVHLGQEDLVQWPLARARARMGRDRLIGVSTHSFGQFCAGHDADTDYVAFGPVFPTLTKKYAVGITDIERVMAYARKPVVFIGGITVDNVSGLLARGARIIAVIRAVTAAPDVAGAVCAFRKLLDDRPGESGT